MDPILVPISIRLLISHIGDYRLELCNYDQTPITTNRHLSAAILRAMGHISYHSWLTQKFVTLSLLAHTEEDLDDPDLEEICQRLLLDLDTVRIISQSRYLRGRKPVEKAGNIHLAWKYAESGDVHDEARFTSMLRVSPVVFDVLIQLIKDHPIFQNNSNNPQSPVDYQLAVTLYRMGHFGNAASLEDIARLAGCSEGSVELFTDRCFTAIEGLHNQFVRKLTEEEKEQEKKWIDQQMGFKGLWREGWLMYDGTIVVLYAAPQWHGEAYYTRKSNYGLNVQVSISKFKETWFNNCILVDWKCSIHSAHY